MLTLSQVRMESLVRTIILGIINEHLWVLVFIIFNWSVVPLIPRALVGEWSSCTLLEITSTVCHVVYVGKISSTRVTALIWICNFLCRIALQLIFVTELKHFRTARVCICKTSSVVISKYLVHPYVQCRIISASICWSATVTSHALYVKLLHRYRSIHSDTWIHLSVIRWQFATMIVYHLTDWSHIYNVPTFRLHVVSFLIPRLAVIQVKFTVLWTVGDSDVDISF